MDCEVAGSPDERWKFRPAQFGGLCEQSTYRYLREHSVPGSTLQKSAGG